MGRTFIRQDAQVRQSVLYDDTIAPTEAAYETNAASIEADLNSLRSLAHNVLQRDGASFPGSGNWFDDLTQPSALETGTIRGVDAVNAALHLIEKKRVLRDVVRVGVDVGVTAAQNFEILTTGELPTNTTAAVGAVTTKGTVIAFHSGTFGTHALDEVAGTNTLNPKNLLTIVDATTGDPILSDGRRIWGLLQSEIVTDGHTMNYVDQQAQISFVRQNSTFDDLEACPVGDIATKTINYSSRERVALDGLSEADFLRGATEDVPVGVSVTRQVTYDGQGATPVDLTTNAILDLEGAGLEWQVRDDLEAVLLRIIEGSAGGTSKVAIEADVDELDVNAVVTDFLNGVKIDTGAAGTTIQVGVVANQIDSGGALVVASGGAADLTLNAALELILSDGNKAGSGYAGSLKLTDTSTEWDNYETEFGEVSIFNALVQASQKAARVKGQAILQNNVAADTDVDATTSSNLDVDLPDYSGVDAFVDDVDVYLNGELLRNGADAAANEDVYPGSTPAQGMLKFEFALFGTGAKPDQLSMIVWGS